MVSPVRTIPSRAQSTTGMILLIGTSKYADCTLARTESVRALEEILLIDGIKHLARRLLHDFVLQGWNRDRSLFPIFLGDIDPAQRLGPILALFELFMKLLDIPRGILLIHLVCDAVYSRAGFLSEPLESRVQRFRCDQVSDRKESSLRILLG